MNIWSWVAQAQRRLEEEGHHRLSKLITQLPSACCDDHHEQVDAIFPEALALARSVKHPWLELFVRHWNLQSRVLHRFEVADCVGEAVSLIEFAAREEARGCPQAVCVTQDLVNCYGNMDGPGFAPERLEATTETLERITPSWPCFRCISGEKVEALHDAGRLEEALLFAETQEALIVAAGAAYKPNPMGAGRVDLLIALGRLDEAWALNEIAAKHTQDESDRAYQAISKAEILARQGLFDEARAALPSFESCFRTPGKFTPWAQVAVLLARGGATPNSWHLDGQLARMGRKLGANGARRKTIQIATWRAELAIERGHPQTASLAADVIATQIPKLRQPLGAPEALAALRLRIEASPAPPLVEGDVLAGLGSDPEMDWWQLQNALKTRPGDEALILPAAHALRALSREEEALHLLQQAVESAPRDGEVGASAEGCFELLTCTLLETGHPDVAARIAADRLDGASPEIALSCRWVLVRAAAGAIESGAQLQAQLQAQLEAVLALDPGSTEAALWLARLDQEAGRLEAAIARLDRVVAAQDAPGSWDWARMVVGTLLGRWDTVRHSASRVGMELDAETGPIDENWGLCRVQYGASDGELKTVYAMRTGPVTASVLEIGRLGPDTTVGDTVVFEASPVNAEADADAEDPCWIYPVIATLVDAEMWAFDVDGAYPGEAVEERLFTALREHGCRVERRADASYELEHPTTGATMRAMYLWVAAPPEVAVETLDAALRAHLAPALTVWPGLATRLSEALGAQHRALAETLGI